ncbi:MAG: LPS export ABC transporter permease LptF [Caulobacteraceae bacterium]
MKLIDRYLFRQLLGPTLLATIAFSTVMLLGQSLQALDLIVNQGQSAAVFVKITLLGLPSLVSMILPITIFVASLVALNRLQTEQELVVCFAGGMSRWRVISPVLRLAVMAAIVSLAINLWVSPYCARSMREELFKVRTDLASTLVQAGQFTQPSKGLTVYASEVQNHNTLKNLFIDQQNFDGTENTFSAREGQIAERNGQPVIVMKHGSNQSLSKTGVLNYVVFDEYIFDLEPFLPRGEAVHYKASDRYLHELFYPDLSQIWEKQNRLKLYAEGHARLAEPLYNIALVTLALAAVLGGGFSRLGYGKRILTAIGVAAVDRIAGFGVQAVADDTVWLNALQYAVPLAAIAWGLGQVFHKPARVPRAPRAAALAAPASAA